MFTPKRELLRLFRRYVSTETKVKRFASPVSQALNHHPGDKILGYVVKQYLKPGQLRVLSDSKTKKQVRIMTANAAYLEHYLDSLETLPSELQRNFNLMRDLDTRAQDELKVIDKMSSEFLNDACTLNGMVKTEKVDVIKKLYKKSRDFADDKVQLAMQTYEMVDKHIRRLDADLARFEADLKEKALNPLSSDSDSSNKKKSCKILEKSEKKKGRRSTAAFSEDDDVPKSFRKKQKAHPLQVEISTLSSLTITHPSDVLDMPVDPNEPTYCFCHQVSYGEMIGCDNVDCPIEWFHFACVGLTSKPKGKWYCSKCSADRKKK